MLPALAALIDRAAEAAATHAKRQHYLAHGAVVTSSFRALARDAASAASSAAEDERLAHETSHEIASAWASVPEIRPLTQVDIYDHCQDRLRRREEALAAARGLERWARMHDRLLLEYGGHGLRVCRDAERQHARRLRREADRAVEPHGEAYYRRAATDWLLAVARRES